MNSTETAQWLKERDNFLILTHLRPDGDTLGSGAGLCQGLREAGKTAFLLENGEVMRQYLPYVEKYWAPAGFAPEHIVTVDTAAEDMIQPEGGHFLGKVDLCIDHHLSNTGYGAVSCVNPQRAACGEIIYEILCFLSEGVSIETAALLYIALSTDTGCFCYGNTTAGTLKTAAALIEAGAPSGSINKRFFRTKSRTRIVLEGILLSGIELLMGGQMAIAAISRAEMEELGATEDDTDDIANLPGQIEGVIIGVTIRELADETCKISVRTTPESDANIICGQLGGGGHKMAGGCSVRGTLAVAREKIIEAVRHERDTHHR